MTPEKPKVAVLNVLMYLFAPAGAGAFIASACIAGFKPALALTFGVGGAVVGLVIGIVLGFKNRWQ